MSNPRQTANWRVIVGGGILLVSLAWPVLIPISLAVGLRSSWVAAMSGVMVVVADFMLLLGAAIASKDGFAFLKLKVSGLLRTYGPPREVTRSRYRLGLILLATSVLFGWAAPYFGHHLPGYVRHAIGYAVVGDLVLLASLLVLGGEFWEKLWALMDQRAKVIFPGETNEGDADDDR